MFVPSMVTDSVTALDTDSGAELWKFFADGPVRLAPVARDGRVYFVSDDGHLYDLATGEQTFFRGIRAGCTNALIPAGGILSAPNFSHGCSCNYAVFSSFALAPLGEFHCPLHSQ